MSKSATMIGIGKKKTIFIVEMISVFARTCQKIGDEKSVWKCLIPTQMFGGMMRSCSKAILASQIGK